MSVERIQTGYSDEDDILSVMPRDVIASILGKLPIREAVRSSILSKNWRFYYLYIPELVFDDQFCIGLDHYSKKKKSDGNVSCHNKSCLFGEIITKSLMLHPGELERFEVSILYAADSTTISNVNKWILYLSQRNIKKFNLFTSYHHTLPSYFFSWSNLTSLKLQRVVLSLPLEFKGFPNLDEVILTGVFFRNNCFERFIMFSSLLRSILLNGCSGIDNYNISGSNLKSLSIKANDFKSISLENAPNLSEVSISLKGAITGPFSDLDMFIGSLPQVKILRLNGTFLQFLLVENPVPAILSTSPYSLKILELKGVNMDFNQISAVVCLLRCAPNLQELYIEASRIDQNQEQVSDYLKHQQHKKYPLNKLHRAKLTEITGYATEIEFIRFLLFNSPSLERLSIMVHKLVRVPVALEMATKVFQFRPPSGASIEFNGE